MYKLEFRILEVNSSRISTSFMFNVNVHLNKRPFKQRPISGVRNHNINRKEVEELHNVRSAESGKFNWLKHLFHRLFTCTPPVPDTHCVNKCFIKGKENLLNKLELHGRHGMARQALICMDD